MNKELREIGSFSVNNKKSQLILYIMFLLIAGLGVGIIFLTKVYTNNNVPIWVIILSVIALIVVHELIHIIFMSILKRACVFNQKVVK